MTYELTGNVKKAIIEFENILQSLQLQKTRISMAEKKIEEALKVITKMQEDAGKNS